MLHIRSATPAHAVLIQLVAHQTWPVAFRDILTAAQIDYMLNMMYSLPALLLQMEQKNHVFLLAYHVENCLGFASYELQYKNKPVTKIHKIYVLPVAQGQGVGKLLMESIEGIARQHNAEKLSLNVNLYNPALHFYHNTGFITTGRENIDIGGGYLMEDFILEKNLIVP